MSNATPWHGRGTVVLGVLLERIAGGQEVVVSRADVEKAAFGTTHPVEFTLADDGETLVMRVRRPAIFDHPPKTKPDKND